MLLNQKWKALGELCVAATSATVGAELQLEPCDAHPTLSRWQFAFLAPQGVSFADTNPCLSVAPFESVEGAPLTLVGCADNSDPADLSLAGKVKFKNGMCAAVKGTDAVAGALVVLRP